MNQKLTQNILKIFFTAIFSVMGFAPATFAATTAGKGAPRTLLPKFYLLDSMAMVAGHLAADKACHNSVKAFGLTQEADHGAHRSQVIIQAEKRNIPYSQAKLTISETAHVRNMQKDFAEMQVAAGCDFDSDYLVAVIYAHRFAISIATAAMTSENDSEIREFLVQTRSALRAHLVEAHRLLVLIEKNGGQDESGDQGDQDDGQQDGQDGDKKP